METPSQKFWNSSCYNTPDTNKGSNNGRHEETEIHLLWVLPPAFLPVLQPVPDSRRLGTAGRTRASKGTLMPPQVRSEIKDSVAVAHALLLAEQEWLEMQAAEEKKVKALKEGPQTDDELWEAARDLTGLKVSQAKVCPHHCSPMQALADAYFARRSMCIWKASRGLGGKTVLLALLAHLEAVFLGAEITILGGSGQQSERVHKAQDQFWTYPTAPRQLLSRDPTLYETFLKNGGHTVALMASTRSARGPHPQRLRLDEIDEMELLVLDASLGQTMTNRGIPAQTVMSSTHQYPDGTMTEMYKRAADRQWGTYEWCYRENLVSQGGWLDDAEVARKRSEVTQAMWDAEYEGQEPSPESRAIVTQAVEEYFDPTQGEYAGALGEDIEIEPPLRSGTYSTGADWAKDKDYTIVWTFRTDCSPMRLVAYKRDGRRPWPLMVQVLDDRLKKYPGRAAHDATGLGDVVDDLLQEDVEGLNLRGKVRSEMLNEYIKAVEAGDIKAPRIEYAYAEHKYATLNDLYGTGHLPDNIAAGAIALWAHRHGTSGPAGVFFA